MWVRSPNIECVFGKPIVKLVNRLAPEHQGDLDAMPPFNLEPQETEGKGRVLTHEGFSFSFVNQPENAGFIAAKQAYVSRGLRNVSSTVMFIVRDPIRWIRSFHAQSIHQGGHQNAQNFLTTQRQVILENLNIERLFRVWREQGLRVVVLPMELYIGNRERFWSTYESSLDSPIPSNRTELVGSRRNQSNPETLPLGAEINRLQGTLEMLVQRGDSPEKDKILETLDYVRRWGARRALESATPQELAELSQRIPHQSKHEFHHAALDDALLRQLSETYIAPLREFDLMAEWVEGYAESVARGLSDPG